jgi:hypothetical protein
MRQFIVAGLLASGVLLGFAETSRADFFLRVPFVRVHVNRGAGVLVGAGPVQVQTPARLEGAVPGVVVSESVPVVPADTLPSPTPLVAPAVGKAMTVEQFVECFKPQGGNYEVVLIHPKSGCPVKVCFALPPGCPTKVRWTKHVLEFDYGRDCVRIRFYHNGDVKAIS